jgi:transposase
MSEVCSKCGSVMELKKFKVNEPEQYVCPVCGNKIEYDEIGGE